MIKNKSKALESSDTLTGAWLMTLTLTLGVLRFRLGNVLRWARRHVTRMSYATLCVCLLVWPYDTGYALTRYGLPALAMVGAWKLGQAMRRRLIKK